MDMFIFMFTSVIAEATAVAAKSFTVPLMQQDVPVYVKGRVVSHKTAYFGEVAVGLPRPQNFTVVFDTGSGHLFLPSAACNNESCLIHRRYDRDASHSAVDINQDGEEVNVEQMSRDQVSISYGTGQILGEFVRDHVCLAASSGLAEINASANCAVVRVITAHEMTPEPFRSFKFDGVLGLGLEALALDPEFHFLTQLTRTSGVAPIFGVYLKPWNRQQAPGVEQTESCGEITFGGHDMLKTSGPIAWVPVQNPEAGHWSISIRSMRIGDEHVPFCDDGTCTAILDTGTSMLGVPKDIKNDLIVMTARQIAESSMDCRDVPGPPIIFQLDDGAEMMLEAQDYSRPAPSTVQLKGEANVVCRSSLLSIDMPALGPKVFIWGEPVLRRYYTVYDARPPQRIGIAPSKAVRPPSFRGAASMIV